MLPWICAKWLRNICKSGTKMIVASILTARRWGSMTPLRQFKGVPKDVIRKAESKQFVSTFDKVINLSLKRNLQPWYRYFDLVS